MSRLRLTREHIDGIQLNARAYIREATDQRDREFGTCLLAVGIAMANLLDSLEPKPVPGRACARCDGYGECVCPDRI